MTVINHSKTIIELFEQQVAATPRNIALVSGCVKYTYESLNNRVNQLARHLQYHGISSEDVVGLYLERSPESIISLLAVLKAGGAFLPLNTSMPISQLQYTLENSQSKIIISMHRSKELEVVGDTLSWLVLDEINDTLGNESTANLEQDVAFGSLAYIIYTSGSTGQPKGVEIEHRSLPNLAMAQIDALQITNESRILQFASLYFDVSIAEILISLLSGACLFIPPDTIRSNIEKLLDYIKSEQISIAILPPALLSGQKAKSGMALKTLVVTGDVCAKSILDDWRKYCQVINLYGPTETTVWTSMAMYDGEHSQCIGAPLTNISYYVLDEKQSPVKLGEVGELHIGGVSLARGYRGQTKLTDNKFICWQKNHNTPAIRLYKTGDLVRQFIDGRFDYIGRNDFQIKFNGVRIAPSEIEIALNKHPGIAQAVVVLKQKEQQEYLAAYIVTKTSQEINPALLRRHLKSYLPINKIPNAYMFLDKFVLSSTGKINRDILPDIKFAKSASVKRFNHEQENLRKLWASILLIDKDSIDLDTDFFSLGGTSLLASRLVCELSQQKLKLHLSDIFECSTIASLTNRLGELALIDATPITPTQSLSQLPLSFAQQRLWLAHHVIYQKRPQTYNINLSLSLKGILDIVALKKALQDIIERHQILKTYFPELGKQVIGDFILSLEHCKHDDASQKLEQLLQKINNHNFGDLSEPPLLRAVLVEIDETNHILCLVFHHIIIDGLSLPVFLEELVEFYQCRAQNKHPSLESQPLQYADFTVWEQQQFSEGRYDNALHYWKKQLQGASGTLNLPFDHARPQQATHKGGAHIFHMPPSFTLQLKSLAKQHEVSLFALLLTSISVLLYRYNQQDDFIIGIAHGERPHPNLNKSLGFFVNMLPLRIQQDNTLLVSQILQQIHTRLITAYQYNAPLETIIETLDLPQQPGGAHPLFQVSATLHDELPLDFSNDMLDISLRENSFVEVSNLQSAKFDLGFEFEVSKDNYLTIKIEYASDLFDQSTIVKMAQQWNTLFDAITQLSTVSIGVLPTLTIEQQQKCLMAWHNSITSNTALQEETMLALFDKQVELQAEATAIIDGDLHLNYRELDQQANQLAHFLQQQYEDIDLTDQCIAIALNRSASFIISALAILKTGAAYLPLDPDLPVSRLNFMLKDAAVHQVITQYEFAEKLLSGEAKSICLDEQAIQNLLVQQPTYAPTTKLKSNNLAYVIYTSGSTGKPKGVMIEHHNVVNLVRNTDYIDLQPNRAMAHLCNVTFDVSVFEIWASLLNGLRLVVCNKEMVLEPALLKQTFQQQKVDFAVIPTAIFYRLLVSDHYIFSSIKSVIFIGEKIMDSKVVQELLDDPNAAPDSLLNIYGPTEDTVFSTCYTMKQGQKTRDNLPIGLPISNSKVYVLDTELQAVAEGIVGELFLGGTGLARGYLNRPELTQQRFIKNPFSVDENDRLYRTGDLVRYDADGNLEFIKRADQQIKVSGYRVELGGIEKTLLALKDIKEAVVLQQMINDRSVLVAYIVPHQSLKDLDATSFKKNIKIQLGQFLPYYMLPSVFMLLEELPLNVNDKIDRHRLPALHFESLQKYIAPSTQIEKQLASLWKTVLNYHKDISIKENFFMIGGSSLLAMQLTSLINKKWGRISYSDLFTQPTIESQARLIDTPEDLRITPTQKMDYFKQEAILDDDIQLPKDAASGITTNPKNILLTGVTGFLGIFILEQLLLKSDTTIYCIIRADNQQHAEQRFNYTLERFRVTIPKEQQCRIRFLNGDISQAFFGLTQSTYTELAEKIELIYHSASAVNFAKPYSALKKTNIDGTKYILRFATDRKIKPLHYISTAAAFSFVHYFQNTDYLAEKSINWDHAYAKSLPHDLGYVQSKAVAEKLIYQAIERGIPASIYRSGFILCHSQTGAGSTEQLWTMAIKDCLQIGTFPLFNEVKGEFITVDYASQAIVAISQHSDSIGKTFHIVPAPENNITTTELFELIASIAHKPKKESLSNWRNRLQKYIDDGNEAELALLMPLFTDSVVNDLTLLEAYQYSPHYSVNNVQKYLANTDITCPAINQLILSRYLRYLSQMTTLKKESNYEKI